MSPRLDRAAAVVSPDGRPESKARLYEEFAQGGKALANGKRLELLDLLAQGERTVESLAGAAGLNLTTVSANLQILKQAGFGLILYQNDAAAFRMLRCSSKPRRTASR